MAAQSPYFLKFSHLRDIITWLLTVSDKNYMDEYPALHKTGQALLSQLFLIEDASEVKFLGVYDANPWEAIKVLINGQKALTIMCDDTSNYFCAHRIMQSIEMDAYRHERFILSTSPQIPDSINEFQDKGFKIIDRNEILSFLIQHENVNDLIKNYVRKLTSDFHPDFSILPIGYWSGSDYVDMFKYLQKGVSDLQYSTTSANGLFGWNCEIRKPVQKTNVMIRFRMEQRFLERLWYFTPGFLAESINGEGLSKLHFKQLQNTLRLEFMKAGIDPCFIRFPKVNNTVTPKRFRLASISSHWIFNLYNMVPDISLIDADLALERMKIIDQIVTALSKVNLVPIINLPNNSHPSLDL